MKSSTAKKSLGAVLVCATVLVPAIASANYPPVPKDLGRRVETRVLAPAVIATTAAVAIKREAIAVVVEPKANLRTLTLRAVNQRTGRVTTRTIIVRTVADTVTAQVVLPAGRYRVQVIGTLKNGRVVRWNAGAHNVIAKSR